MSIKVFRSYIKNLLGVLSLGKFFLAYRLKTISIENQLLKTVLAFQQYDAFNAQAISHTQTLKPIVAFAKIDFGFCALFCMICAER